MSNPHREAFEIWYATIQPGAQLKTTENGYTSPNARVAWRAWQAAEIIEREACAKTAEAHGCHVAAYDIRKSSWRK